MATSNIYNGAGINNTALNPTNGRKLTIDKNGVIYIVFADFTTGYVKVFKSSDNQVTWQDINFPILKVGYYSTAPAIAISPDNELHVVWQGASNDFSEYAQIRYSKFNGVSWSSIQTLSNTNGYAQLNPSIAIDSAGVIHVAWDGCDSSYTTKEQISYIFSQNKGDSWSNRVYVGPYSTTATKRPCVVIDKNNNVYIFCEAQSQLSPTIFNVRYSKKNSDGTWPTFSNITNSNLYNNYYVSACVDSSNNIHLIWCGDESAGYLQIKYSKFDGNTWSNLINICSINGYRQIYPYIYADILKNLYVLWIGKDPTNPTYDQLKYSKFNGTSWSSYTNIKTFAAGIAGVTIADKIISGGQLEYAWVNNQNSINSDFLLVNSAPTIPTNLIRNNFDATEQVDFLATFNDPDINDSISALQVIVTNHNTGALVFDSNKIIIESNIYQMVANLLSNEQQYDWKIRFWDKSDAVSPYSSQATFWCSAKPVVNITNPANDGNTVTLDSLTTTWSLTSGLQSAYQVKLLNASGTEILFDSGKVISSQQQCTIPYTLLNNTNYQMQTTIWDDKDVQSQTVTRTFVVVYAAPMVPLVNAINNDLEGNIYITINNPTPDAGRPNVLYNDIYRREQSGGTWERIATNIPNNGNYYDYNIASGIMYQYQVKTYGDNETSCSSLISSNIIYLKKIWLHIAAEGWSAKSFKNKSRRENWQPESQLVQYSGRKKPVLVYSIYEENNINLNLFIETKIDLDSLKYLIQSKKMLCYRDSLGRKLFGQIRNLPIDDQPNIGHNISATFAELDYDEEV